MRQIVFTKYGPPEVLQVREASEPVPGPGEVRISVQAAGINFADVLARLGLYPDAPSLPLVVGYEVAGVVDAVGPGVEARGKGDRVLAFTRFGGYSESVVVRAEMAFPVPAGLTDAEAAAVPVNYLTAHLALYRQANVQAGETVLVHSVGGGVGIAALQLAKLRGAVVLGTASASKHDALRAMGVDHLIDYRTADVGAEVRRLTRGRGVDVVLDPIGGKSFRESYGLLAPLGRAVLYGASSAVSGERRRWWRALQTLWEMPAFKAIPLINANRGVFGLNLAHLWSEARTLGAGMERILAELAAGRLRPVVARTFPLSEAAAAHRFLQSRSNIGKVLLTRA
jgi:synaptic vesicle membrane protein VAT-1